MPEHGDLTGWAKQGVLLLNTVLTVDEGDAASHSKKAQWEHFTHHILKALAKEKKPMVVLAWGKHAHKAAQFFTYPQKVIKTSEYENFLGSIKTITSETIANNVRTLITQEYPTNPKFYETMSRLLDEIIEHRRDDSKGYANYLERIFKSGNNIIIIIMGTAK